MKSARCKVARKKTALSEECSKHDWPNEWKQENRRNVFTWHKCSRQVTFPTALRLTNSVDNGIIIVATCSLDQQMLSWSIIALSSPSTLRMEKNPRNYICAVVDSRSEDSYTRIAFFFLLYHTQNSTPSHSRIFLIRFYTCKWFLPR